MWRSPASTKFDGRRTRPLHPHEVGQIAGRAGRFRSDGTFGVTGRLRGRWTTELVAAVEGHAFDAVAAAQWRNGELDFHSLADLLRSLSAPAAARTG